MWRIDEVQHQKMTKSRLPGEGKMKHCLVKAVTHFHKLACLGIKEKKKEYQQIQYLNESDTDIIFYMSVPIFDISHDKITQFATELHSCRATSNNNAV